MPRNTVSIATIRAANEAAGRHFFDRDSMRFFRSRIESSNAHLSGDGKRAYFVTSEQFVPSSDIPAPRKYTVRVADRETGDVDTHGDFQGYGNFDDAKEAARAASNT